MRLPVRKIIPALATSLAILGAASLAVSCGGGGGTEPSSPGRISITPTNPPPIPAGGTLSLSATVFDTKGQAMSGQTVAFSTSAG